MFTRNNCLVWFLVKVLCFLSTIMMIIELHKTTTLPKTMIFTNVEAGDSPTQNSPQVSCSMSALARLDCATEAGRLQLIAEVHFSVRQFGAKSFRPPIEDTGYLFI